MDDAALRRALSAIQDRGGIGTTGLDDAIAHADRYVALLPVGSARVADLGSGGGLPGLVIAWRRTDLRLVLVERRLTRADLLRRAVSALGMGDRVAVHAADVRALADVERARFDVVTARSFAAPEVTALWAGRLLRSGGLLLVSEPPSTLAADDQWALRWPASLLDRCGLEHRDVVNGIRCFRRR
jgi:16S rRNA (guanine527-N7)-methyltransferase